MAQIHARGHVRQFGHSGAVGFIAEIPAQFLCNIIKNNNLPFFSRFALTNMLLIGYT
jgi:hypothetical protein